MLGYLTIGVELVITVALLLGIYARWVGLSSCAAAGHHRHRARRQRLRFRQCRRRLGIPAFWALALVVLFLVGDGSGPCVRADRRLILQLENSMSRLPSLYISHGSPMTALHPGQVGVRLAELARDLPTPRAIVMASALAGPAAAGRAHPQPPTIHDFGGFPRALFELQYPAPGDPALAKKWPAASPPQDCQWPSTRSVASTTARGYRCGCCARADIRWCRCRSSRCSAPSISSRWAVRWRRCANRACCWSAPAASPTTCDWGDYQDGKEAPYVRPFIEWVEQRLAAADRQALLDYRRQAPFAERAPDRRAPAAAVLCNGRGRRGRFRCASHRCRIDAGFLAMDLYRFDGA